MATTILRSVLLAAAALLCIESCTGPQPPSSSSSIVPIKTYKLSGSVVSVVPRDRLVKVQHQKIEGWMEAMTMEFPVRDDSEFARLAPGQRIQATVNVQDIDYWLSAIQFAEEPPPPPK